MPKKYVLSDGLNKPVVENIYIIIDDAGTSNTDFLGFTALMIDEFTFRSIESKIRDFCLEEHIINLHARNLEIEGVEAGQLDMDEYFRIYQKLFDLIIPELEKANYVCLVNLLTSQNINLNFCSNHHDIFNRVSGHLIDSSLPSSYHEFYSYFALPTMEIVRRINNCAEDIRLNVIIDRKDDFDSISNHTVFLKGNLGALLFKLNEVVVKVFNAYINNTLRNNCKISTLSVVSSKANPLIGVVDAFCNFSYNYAKVVIQGESNSNTTELRKYNTFRNVLVQNSLMNLNQIEETKTAINNNFGFASGRIIPTTNREISTFVLFHS